MSISVCAALFTGIFFLLYTDIGIQCDLKKDDRPKNIAYHINPLLPEDVDIVYEIGYRRLLGITCYLKKEVIQLDSFSQLKSVHNKGGGIYFIFDTAFLDRSSEDDRKSFLEEIKWEKVYSSYLKKEKSEIVVGYLR